MSSAGSPPSRRSLEEWNSGLPPAQPGAARPETPPDASVIDLRLAETPQRLIDFYTAGSTAREVLLRVLGHALSNGAVTGLLEYRYTDQDYRDEHQRFYSTTHRRYPSSAHRLHLFRDLPQIVRRRLPLELEGLDYLGYVVLRPVRAAPVGRTMLAPQPTSARAVMSLADDRVNLFGTDFIVAASPFIAQDAQLTRCAHASMWTTAYFHHIAYGGRRVLPGLLAESAGPWSTDGGRLIPSLGLTPAQLSAIASSIDLPPLVYPLAQPPGGQTVERIVCRYLNSRFPVTIITEQHAFTLVGYEPTVSPTGERSVTFFRHDDEVGPYQRVPNWRLDTAGNWRYAIVPMPNKVYLSGESAERVARTELPRVLRQESTSEDDALLARIETDEAARQPTVQNPPGATPPARSASAGRSLAWRSMVLPSNELKRLAGSRGYAPPARHDLLLSQLSRWVWLVELTDLASLRSATQPPRVLAEAVVDATEHARDPHLLFWRSATSFGVWRPDVDRQVARHTADTGDWPSLIETYHPRRS